MRRELQHGHSHKEYIAALRLWLGLKKVRGYYGKYNNKKTLIEYKYIFS